MLCNQHPLFNLQHCVLLFIWVILLLSHSTQGPRWFCMWVLLGASQLCVASLSARPSWVSPQAGQDITMSHRWLMAVLSQGLMTSSLVFSFVSPVISVSKQKREAMCSMCDPTLLHRCRHTEEEKHEWTSFLLFYFYYTGSASRDSHHYNFMAWCWEVQGSPSLRQTEHMLSISPIWNTHLSSASVWHQKVSITNSFFPRSLVQMSAQWLNAEKC